MRIEEFWRVAPCEAMEFIEEATREKMTLAYFIGAMHHADPQKYPKRPEELWDKTAGEMSVEQLKMLALAWATNGAEFVGEIG